MRSLRQPRLQILLPPMRNQNMFLKVQQNPQSRGGMQRSERPDEVYPSEQIHELGFVERLQAFGGDFEGGGRFKESEV